MTANHDNLAAALSAAIQSPDPRTAHAVHRFLRHVIVPHSHLVACGLTGASCADMDLYP